MLSNSTNQPTQSATSTTWYIGINITDEIHMSLSSNIAAASQAEGWWFESQCGQEYSNLWFSLLSRSSQLGLTHANKINHDKRLANTLI